jgi:hypothetical protein
VLCVLLALPPFAADWIVVSVVVRERTEAAGEENVLSPPRRPPPTVRVVPVSDDAPWDGAAMDLDVSRSVETVRATDLAPDVAGGSPSREDVIERWRSREVSLPLPVDTE